MTVGTSSTAAPTAALAPALRTAPLAPGDRAPDFLLPDQDKAVDPFYDLVRGGPIVLHFFPSIGEAAHRAEFDRFVKRHAGFATLGAQVMAIDTDTLDANILAAATDGVPFALLTDPGGRVHRQYGVPVPDPGQPAEPSARSIVTFVLDANQRVLETIQGRGMAPHAERALACLERSSPASAAETVTMTAPVLIVPRVLDRAFCRRLIEVWATRGNTESGTITLGKGGREAKTLRADVKRRRDHHVKDPALFREISDTVFARVAPEVGRAFDAELSRVEEFKIVRYDADEGGFFRPHRDNSVPARGQRRFAMTLNLNTEDYEGGELRFPEYGPNLYRPGTGDAVVFACSLLHEALDVTRGSRFVLLSFLLDRTPERWQRDRKRWLDANIAALEAGLKAQRGGP
ncbi:MAG: redoxin domain-containing protein [Alphaproteobacteria bacterium]